MKNILLILVILSTSFAFAATSEEGRVNKKYELSLQTGGDYRFFGTQISGMYFLDPNNLVGFKIGTGSSGEQNQTNISAQYKHFYNNSFYIAGETFYLNTTEDIDGYWGDFFNLHSYASYSSLGAGVRIGNQWTWENFTLGCDWVGVGHRVGRFRKDSPDVSDTTVTYLNLIIGASF
jgi:hypothetical protein